MSAQVIHFPADRTKRQRAESPRFIELAQRLLARTEELRRLQPDAAQNPPAVRTESGCRLGDSHLRALAERMAAAMDYIETKRRGMA